MGVLGATSARAGDLDRLGDYQVFTRAFDREVGGDALVAPNRLPGLRAGWLVIRNKDLRDQLINWKHYTTICPAGPTEFLARKALLVKEKLAERSKAIIQENLKLCEAFFTRFPEHFIWRRPLAGSVAFIEVDLAKLGFDSATAHCHHLAQNHGIVLLPGKCLGFNVEELEKPSRRVHGQRSTSSHRRSQGTRTRTRRHKSRETGSAEPPRNAAGSAAH